MHGPKALGGLLAIVGVALLVDACHDSVGPEHHAPVPARDVAASPSIALDKWNGTLGENGTELVKGFNPTNPNTGDAIIATFFWVGSTNIITSVTDYVTSVPPTPVGNQYSLVEYVTSGGLSMATYVAINVQNFPGGLTNTAGDMILAVKATLSQPVADGGVLLSAWTGVATASAQAVGAHSSGAGSGMGPTIADPGAIPITAGALAYGVTLSYALGGVTGPAGFTNIATMSDLVMKNDGEYDAEFAVQQNGGSVDPQWTWDFTVPTFWSATVLALNPPPTTGNLTVTTNTAGANLPPNGYTVTVDGTQSQPIATNGNVAFTGLTAGAHSVALAGVPANCTVNGANPVSVTVPAGGTAAITFSIQCAPTTGSLTVTTSTSGANLPPNGYTVTVDGTQSQPIATSGSVTFTGLTAGGHSVLLAGVPANCSVNGANPANVTVPAGGTAALTFFVACTAPVNDFMTGGGKLGNGREFATFGFEARPSGGKLEWVQHCPDGQNDRDDQEDDPASPPCTAGKFTFHGTVTAGSYAAVAGAPTCRTWSGSGSAKETGAHAFTVRMACDNNERGRGHDYIDIVIDGYHNAGYLSGGKIQLHKSKS